MSNRFFHLVSIYNSNLQKMGLPYLIGKNLLGDWTESECVTLSGY